jgi:hypothetical protein
MVISKTPFFLMLFGLIVVPLVVPRLIWLVRSRPTLGVMGFEGRGTAGDQIALTYWYVYYRPEEMEGAGGGMGRGGGEKAGSGSNIGDGGSEIVTGADGQERVCFTAPCGLPYKEGDSVTVRYLAGDWKSARVDCLIGLWGDILVYGGIPGIILLISFLHPEVVPWGSKVRLSRKRPYISLWSTHRN